MMQATGCQSHWVRGFLAGVVAFREKTSNLPDSVLQSGTSAWGLDSETEGTRRSSFINYAVGTASRSGTRMRIKRILNAAAAEASTIWAARIVRIACSS
jgi:hypothetical protein